MKWVLSRMHLRGRQSLCFLSLGLTRQQRLALIHKIVVYVWFPSSLPLQTQYQYVRTKVGQYMNEDGYSLACLRRMPAESMNLQVLILNWHPGYGQRDRNVEHLAGRHLNVARHDALRDLFFDSTPTRSPLASPATSSTNQIVPILATLRGLFGTVADDS